MKRQSGDPYHIRKPSEEVIGRIAFAYSSFNQLRVGTLKLVLTNDYLWLSSELSIPLASIISIELINKNRDILISFFDVLKNQNISVGIYCPALIGASKRKNEELVRKLKTLIQNAKPLEELLTGEIGRAHV